MILKECVERALGEDGRGSIMRFLLDRELADCKDDGERWRSLFEKCDRWERELLLWSDDTYIKGISGWNMFIRVCCCRLPEETADWAAYLYRTSLLAILRYDQYTDEAGRRKITEHARNSSQWKDSYSCGFDDEYILETGFAELTRGGWLDEINGFWVTSWETWREDWNTITNNPEYVEAMEINYPKFKSILERLEREVGDCEVVRMNRHGGDETVWYFVKTQSDFYVVNLTDAM